MSWQSKSMACQDRAKRILEKFNSVGLVIRPVRLTREAIKSEFDDTFKGQEAPAKRATYVREGLKFNATRPGVFVVYDPNKMYVVDDVALRQPQKGKKRVHFVPHSIESVALAALHLPPKCYDDWSCSGSIFVQPGEDYTFLHTVIGIVVTASVSSMHVDAWQGIINGIKHGLPFFMYDGNNLHYINDTC